MINEIPPSLRTRLASLILTTTAALAEMKAIDQELQRIEDAEKQKLSLPHQDWLSLAEVVSLYRFNSPLSCRRWATRNGIEYKTVGRKIFFSRAEFDAKLKSSPSPSGEGKPVKRAAKPTPAGDPVREAAQRAVMRLVNGGGHGS